MVLIRLNCITKKDLMSSNRVQNKLNPQENCDPQAVAQSSLAVFIGAAESELWEKLFQSANFVREGNTRICRFHASTYCVYDLRRKNLPESRKRLSPPIQNERDLIFELLLIRVSHRPVIRIPTQCRALILASEEAT